MNDAPGSRTTCSMEVLFSQLTFMSCKYWASAHEMASQSLALKARSKPSSYVLLVRFSQWCSSLLTQACPPTHAHDTLVPVSQALAEKLMLSPQPTFSPQYTCLPLSIIASVHVLTSDAHVIASAHALAFRLRLSPPSRSSKKRCVVLEYLAANSSQRAA